MDYKKIKTNDLLKKLNRYSFEDKARLCLLFSLKSCNYLEQYNDGKNEITPPWLVDGLITLCVLSKPETHFKKDIYLDGVKDKNFIFDALYNQIPDNWNALTGDVSYFLNTLVNPQIYYQKDDDVILYRYTYLFSYFEKEFLEISGGVVFEKFVFVDRLFSAVKPLFDEGTNVFIFVKQLLELFPEVIVPLSISREDLISKTKELLDDIDNLSKFSYSFKFVSSYPFVTYNDNWYMFAFHNFLNSISTGFMSRITDRFEGASEKLGGALEKYIFKIIDDSKLIESIEDDSILYYIRKQEYRKPDVSFVQNNKLVIIESKKASPILKATYNDIESIKKEIDKGVVACEKSLDNLIRFINGKYSLCGKKYDEYKNVYLVICVENESYWPRETIINKIKGKAKYSAYISFIDNNLFITSLYNIESYFLYGRSVLDELERNRPDSDKHSLIKNSGENMSRGEQLQQFVDKDQEKFESFKNELELRIKNKTAQ